VSDDFDEMGDSELRQRLRIHGCPVALSNRLVNDRDFDEDARRMIRAILEGHQRFA